MKINLPFVLLWFIFVDSHKSGRLQSIIHADPTVLYTKICPTLKKNAGWQFVFRYMRWVFHCTWIPLELGVGSPPKSRVDCRGKNRTWPSCSPSGTWASWTGGWPPCPGRYYCGRSYNEHNSRAGMMFVNGNTNFFKCPLTRTRFFSRDIVC